MIKNYELFSVNGAVKALSISIDEIIVKRFVSLLIDASGYSLISDNGETFQLADPESRQVFNEDIHLFLLDASGNTKHHFHLFVEVA